MTERYLKIKSENSQHIKNLIKWLFEEVHSAGGDGDGIWYSKYFNVLDIEEFINSESLLPKYWNFKIDNHRLVYSHHQECLIITNNEDDFTNRPPWQQVAIIY